MPLGQNLMPLRESFKRSNANVGDSALLTEQVKGDVVEVDHQMAFSCAHSGTHSPDTVKPFFWFDHLLPSFAAGSMHASHSLA